MKQFMGQIPESMIEAAKLDGASHLRVCWQIVMPNVKPAWLTLMIFAFQGAWQITGYLFVYSEQLKPIPIVMRRSRGRYCATGRIVSDSCCADVATYDTLPYSPE